MDWLDPKLRYSNHLRRYQFYANAITKFFELVEGAPEMRFVTAISRLKVIAAATVAVAGLVASTPSVHGTTDIRGAATCSSNTVVTPNCGDRTDTAACYISYTKCKSLTGPKDKICTMTSSSPCAASYDCLIQTNYSWSTDCTPPKTWSGAAAINQPSSSSLPSRVSRLQ